MIIYHNDKYVQIELNFFIPCKEEMYGFIMQDVVERELGLFLLNIFLRCNQYLVLIEVHNHLNSSIVL